MVTTPPCEFAQIAMPLRISGVAGRTAVMLAWMAMAAAICNTVLAIDINLIFDDSTPYFDINGVDRTDDIVPIMEAAAAYWEDIIQENHTFTVHYGWDDVDAIGQYSVGFNSSTQKPTSSTLTFDALDNGTARRWFFDSSPNGHTEFDLQQQLYRDLSAADKDAIFNGNVPDTFEVSFHGPALAIAPENARLGLDFFSVALHQLGHALGLSNAATTASEESDGDYDFKPVLVGGAATAVNVAPGTPGNPLFDLLLGPSLMGTGNFRLGERQLPSATDIFAVVTGSNWSTTDIDVNRTEFLIVANSNWSNRANWLGNRVPDNNMDVYIRDPQGSSPDLDVDLTADGVAGNVFLSEGANLDTNGFTLDVTGDAAASGLGSDLFIRSGGQLEADELRMSVAAEVNLFGTGSIEVRALDNDALLVGRDAGAKSITVTGSLNNNGVIRASGGASLEFTSPAPTPWNLDGTSNDGVVEALTGNVTFLQGALADSFSGTMSVGTDHQIYFLFPWTTDGDVNLNGGAVVAHNARIRGNHVTFSGGSLNVDGVGSIDATTTFSGSVQTTLADAGSTLFVGQPTLPITLSGGTFQGPGKLAFEEDVTVTAGSTATVDVGYFSWDGSADQTDTLVQIGATLNITGDIIENYLADVTIDGGTIDVDTSSPWLMAGRLDMRNAGALLGTARMTLSGALVSTGGGNRIASPLTIASGGSVDVGFGGTAEVEFDGPTTYSGGSYAGSGRIGQTGPATVTATTTVGAFNSFFVLAPGVYKPLHVQQFDWDGDAGGSAQTTINQGVTFTINAVQIDAPATDGYDGTVNVNGGTLVVNTGLRTPVVPPGGGTPGQLIPAAPSALPWRLDGTMHLSAGVGQQAIVTTALGSQMQIYGTVNALSGVSSMLLGSLQSGGAINVRSGATHTATSLTVSGGAVDVDAGATLKLSGAALQAATQMQIDGVVELTANTTMQGGIYMGSGSVLQKGNLTVIATTTLDANVDFFAGSATTIAGGLELRLDRASAIQAGATFGGAGVLRNLAGSTLTLANGSQASVALVNESALQLGTLGAADPTVQSFAQTSTGSLFAEIFPNSNISDKLIVLGHASLDGFLSVSRINELSLPDPGFVYTVLTGNSVVGMFDNAPMQGSRLVTDFGSFQVNYSSTSVTLSNFLPRFSADFDEDGDVDGADLSRWRGGFGTGATHMDGNADGDGDADGADFLAWQRQLGSGLPAMSNSAAAPEPPTLSLLLLANMVLVLRRRSVT